MSSIEEKRKKLAAMRAQREAKDKQMAELAQAQSPAPRAHSVESAAGSLASPAAVPPEGGGGASPPPQSSSGLHHSSSFLAGSTERAAQQKTTIETSIAPVEIEPVKPPAVENFDRACLTDHVFVYNESRPHPNDVVPKEAISGENAKKEDAENNATDENGDLLDSTLGNVSFDGNSKILQKMSANAGKITKSSQFEDFLRKAGLVVSESLNAQSLKTLEGAQGIEEDTNTAIELLQLKASMIAPSVKDKVVTSISFQPGSSEFFCVSYASHEAIVATDFDDDDDVTSEGTVLVWSTKRSHNHPVFIFNCADEVATVSYSRYHPQLLLGGTFKGKVVLWDQRLSSNPVVHSFPSSEGHSMAVFAAEIIGKETNSSLLTACADGRICTWTVEKPKYPLTSARIAKSSGKKGRLANSLAIASSELGSSAPIFIGGADGTLYETVHTATAAQHGMHLSVVGKCHQGAITSIDAHPHSAGDPRLSGIVLTTSMDCTIRVWKGERDEWKSVALDTFNDFVYHVKWSPTNPTVFAACDGGGNVTVWNLAESMDSPVATIVVTDSDLSMGKGAAVAANKLAWNDAGDMLVVGGSQGECYLIGVHHSLVNATDNQLERFLEVLTNTVTSTKAQ